MSRFGEVVAEDLGTVPPFLRPSLGADRACPATACCAGRRTATSYRDPATWPALSVATNATHDTDTTADWYDGLASDERERLRKIPALAALDPRRALRRPRARCVPEAPSTPAPSTLALVPIQDALGGRERINNPGTVERATGPSAWKSRSRS